MTDLWFEDRGSGPPVVLLHEGVVDSRIWDRFLPLVQDRLRTIRYDQRGFGRSPRPDGPYSVADDLVSVLDAAGVEQAALVGCSRGGVIALTTAVERPERVSALVLVGSGLSGRAMDVKWALEQEARWEAAEESGDYAAMAELDMEMWAPMGADDELRAQFLENAEGSNSEHVTTDRPVAGRLGEITAPTLVITGTGDVAAINEVGALLTREIAGARQAVIEETDHMVPWRTPGELAALVLDFVH
jgi:pimeloyl-ACP methyl ester carboxylesterase